MENCTVCIVLMIIKLMTDKCSRITLTVGLVFHDASTMKLASPELTQEERYLKLVTILPSEQKYEDTVTIRAELEAQEEGFSKADLIENVQELREDYEKLRLAYELSKMSVTGLLYF